MKEETKKFSVIGKTFHAGHEMEITSMHDVTSLEPVKLNSRFRFVFLKRGNTTFTNKDKTQFVSSPAVIALNFDDEPLLANEDDLNMDIVYFSPLCFERYEKRLSYDEWKKNLGYDYFYFRPFFTREDNFIGVIPIRQEMSKRFEMLIDTMQDILENQPDENWPCRSRSYLLELIITVNTSFSETGEIANPVMVRASEKIQDIVEFINQNFQNKITLEDITKKFNTNKTTLNMKFKSEMNMTVTSYIISLRMQTACLLLKKTYLSVSEIIDRSGYNDESHFNRAFKKFTGTTPTLFRKQFVNEQYF